TGVNLDLGATLAVHADGDGDALRPGELRVVGGPGATIVHRSIVPGALPELLGDERREWGQQLEQRLRIDAPRGAAGRLLVDVARELHEERDRRVVAKLCDVVVDALDQAVAAPFLRLVVRVIHAGELRRAPHAMEEARHPGDR